MHRPAKAKHNKETGLVDLRFTKDDDCDKDNCQICETLEELSKLPWQQTLDIPHYVRGSIVWPIGRNPGYALVSGQDQTDSKKTIRVFEECSFWSVSNMDFEKGIWYFIQKNLKKYHCQHYFYAMSKEHRRYSMQVRRESLLKAKPYFIEAIYATKSKDEIDNLIDEYVNLEKIKVDSDFKLKEVKKGLFNQPLEGNLFKQLMSHVQGYTKDEDKLPAVKALRALVAGYERVRYHKPVHQEVPEGYF